MADCKFVFILSVVVLVVVLTAGPEIVSARKHHELHDHLDAEGSEEDHPVRRSPDAPAAAAGVSAERQLIRALMSRNALEGAVKRLKDVKSPNAALAQVELDKLIANQKQNNLHETIEKLKAQESTPDVEKLKVDVFLEDYGGVGKDAVKIAKQLVKIETVESQLDKLPYNTGLEYLVATMKEFKPLLIKYNLWDTIMKAKESLKITTKIGK